jgi:FlaA1/EpsC-like NDP-sugar epimerase
VRDIEVEDLLGRDPVEVDLEEMSSYLNGQVILVTGAGGSIGSELCRQIMRFSPKRLLLLDNNENNLYEIEIELKNQYNEKLIYPIVANVQDRIRIDEVFANFRPAIVFHAAAHKHVPLMELNPQEAVKNNIFGTKIVAEAADNYNCKRFVLISTDKAVNPTSVMGATKRIAEMIIQDLNRRSKTKYAAVRFGNVLGSNGSVIPLFKKQIAQGGPVTVTHPEMVRFFMTIPEAVQLVIQAGAMGEGGEIFVLDMGEPVKIVDLASELIRLSGLEPGEDIEIKFIGIRPGEKLYEEVLTAEEGTSATKHRRIFVAKSNKIDSIKLGNTIQMLSSLVNEAKSDILIKQIENLVSTYRPNRTNLVHLFNEGEAVNDWLIKRQ